MIRLPANERRPPGRSTPSCPAARIETKVTSAEADHQRRRGHRGASGLADRVVAREPAVIPRQANEPAEQLARGATTARPRRRCMRRRTGGTPHGDDDRDEDDDRRDAGARRRASSTTRSTSSADDQRNDDAPPAASAPCARAAGPPRAARRPACTRAARIAGSRPGDDGHRGPASSDTHTVRSSITVPLSGRSAPNALNSASSPGARAIPASRPTSDAAEPEHHALGDHRAHDLAARRAERAQQPELARALRDRDRERVEDDERADEQRDVGEDQQEGAQEAAAGSRGPRSAAPPAARRSARRGWRAAPRGCARAARSGRSTDAAATTSVVQGPRLTGDPLGLRRGQQRHARAAERGAATNRTIPEMR